MKTRTKPLVAALLAATMLSATLAGTAMAQGSYSTGDPASSSQTSPDAAAAAVTDEQLENFASAQKDVDKIRTEYIEKVQREQDPQKVAEIETKMQEEMIEVVEDNDLDVSTYNRIANLLPVSNELQQRLQQVQ